MPDKSPAFFFVDIQNSDAPQFDAFIHKAAPGAAVERVPMLRGRIVSANGIRAEDLKPSPQAAWALQSDRGVTYAETIPPGSQIVAGRMVAQRTIPGRRCCRWRSGSPTASG